MATKKKSTAKKAAKAVKKKSTAKKATKAAKKKSTAKKATKAAKATKKKSTAKKTTKKKSTAKKATKAAKKKSTAKKATKAPKKKSTAKKAPARKSGGSGTARARSPFSKKFLEQQRTLLLEERATYTRQAISLQEEADSLVADMEPGDVQFDEESGEGDTINIERERDLALSAQARRQVEEIDAALARIDEGTYGICEVSGEPIPEERLEAIPQTRVRVEYKSLLDFN